jgi:hypothetical protein
MNRVSMLSLIQKNWIHILVWIMMSIYVVTAPDIYTRLILKEGKPVQFDLEIPKPTDQISYSVDRLDFIKGQGLFNLWGWSFLRGDRNQADYERWIILQSSTKTYFYISESFQRPELQSAFKDIDIDLSHAGFFVHISKYAIEPGTYKIGILFRHKSGDTLQYVITNKTIVRTPNQIRMDVSNP